MTGIGFLLVQLLLHILLSLLFALRDLLVGLVQLSLILGLQGFCLLGR